MTQQLRGERCNECRLIFADNWIDSTISGCLLTQATAQMVIAPLCCEIQATFSDATAASLSDGEVPALKRTDGTWLAPPNFQRQHCLNFLPLPHGHGSFLPTLWPLRILVVACDRPTSLDNRCGRGTRVGCGFGFRGGRDGSSRNAAQRLSSVIVSGIPVGRQYSSSRLTVSSPAAICDSINARSTIDSSTSFC